MRSAACRLMGIGFSFGARALHVPDAGEVYLPYDLESKTRKAGEGGEGGEGCKGDEGDELDEEAGGGFHGDRDVLIQDMELDESIRERIGTTMLQVQMAAKGRMTKLEIRGDANLFQLPDGALLLDVSE